MGNEDVSVCSICGLPLTPEKVHGVISGQMHVRIGIDEENVFNVSMHMCKECIRKVAANTVMSIEEARERAQSLENYG